VGPRSDAGRRHIDFSRIRLGITYEFGSCFGWKRRIDHHHLSLSADTPHRRQVTREVVVQVVVERPVDGSIAGDQQQERVTIGLCFGDFLSGEVSAASWFVLDNERLAEAI
jgi:hypothetical protein